MTKILTPLSLPGDLWVRLQSEDVVAALFPSPLGGEALSAQDPQELQSAPPPPPAAPCESTTMQCITGEICTPHRPAAVKHHSQSPQLSPSALAKQQLEMTEQKVQDEK